MNHFLVALTYKCDRYLRYFIKKQQDIECPKRLSIIFSLY